MNSETLNKPNTEEGVSAVRDKEMREVFNEMNSIILKRRKQLIQSLANPFNSTLEKMLNEY